MLIYCLTENGETSVKEYTNLLVFIVQLLRCNDSYIVNDAPAARLESGRKSCAIWYILFFGVPKGRTLLLGERCIEQAKKSTRPRRVE
ncbi:MAG: hypothetical protein BECKG1743D_GA0114223_105234 [Candidatus Kentron sp. G]|nr:MAG: hypothetical protein BECKG1743D_GA0114223_105234 [Candidatus Kentron sp. G]VFN05013.1 MAG: hypothetical protein BECKG1743F_GA0114225_110152 [Candidatus Kentron sp. G]